jgi:hypothetical protein
VLGDAARRVRVRLVVGDADVRAHRHRDGGALRLAERLREIEDHLRRRAGQVLERLEPSQLHAARRGVEDARGLGEVLRALEVRLALDDDVLPIALGDRLARDHLLHLRRELDVLERDELDVQAPLRDELLDGGADLGGDLFAMRQELVELRLADHVAEDHLRARSRTAFS